jgi:hypothetical protein
VDEKTPGLASDAPAALEAQAEVIRDNVGALVGELDRRRKRLVPPLVASGLVMLGLAVGAAWLLGRAAPSRARRLQEALRRATDHPERVAREQPNVAKKILAAAGAAAASVAARKLAQRWLSAR